MKTHQLKSWPEWFAAIRNGRPFDLRKNDRGYNPGDLIRYREYDDKKGVYTGAEEMRRVISVLDGTGPASMTPNHGLANGYCILGLESVVTGGLSFGGR